MGVPTLPDREKESADLWCPVRQVESVERMLPVKESQRLHERPSVLGNSPGGDEIRHEVPAALAREVVIADTLAARRRMEDLISAGVQSDVIDHAVPSAEKHEISLAQIADLRRHR